MPPWFVLLLLISLTLAFAYQLVTRHFGWNVVGYWLAIFAVLLVAEAVSESVDLNLLRLGDLRLLPDLAAAAALLGTMRLLRV